jgi:hypothetical protein
VRIGSSGDDGRVTQINSSSAVSAAGNKNTTDQTVDQSAGGSGGGSAVQYADQKAGNTQDATSDATSHQIGASNANYPVRIGSPGGGGSVTQINASGALSAAGNKNETNQTATQDAGGAIVKRAPLSDGCNDKCGKPSYDGCSDKCGPPSDGCRDTCGGGGAPVVQDAKQKAYNDQTADSSAESTQCCAQNTNAPVRIKSYGDDGDVKQANLSGAVSVAGNKNDTTQYASQDAGSGPTDMVGICAVKDGCGGHGGGGPVVQQADQYASNDQSAHSTADSTQKGASNANYPVRIGSPGGGGSVTQLNGSLAASAAGNLNSTDQTADQSAGGSGGGVTVQALGQKARTARRPTRTPRPSRTVPATPTRRCASRAPAMTVTSRRPTCRAPSRRPATSTRPRRTSRRTPARAIRSWARSPARGAAARAAAMAPPCRPPVSGRRASRTPTRRRTRRRRAPATPTRPCASRARATTVTSSRSTRRRRSPRPATTTRPTRRPTRPPVGGGVNVQALGQKAWNGQGARSNATSDQYDPSNANAPVREHSMGGGGSVLQANASLALSAAGNRNSTCQVATQGSGGLECLKEEREPVHAMKVD